MEFPITELLDYESSVTWITQHFHPTGFRCPECGVPRDQARIFRETRRKRELDALNEVSREIASQLDVRHVLNSVTEKVRTLLDDDSAMLCLMDDTKQYLLLKSTSGVPSIETADRMNVHGESCQRGAHQPAGAGLR